MRATKAIVNLARLKYNIAQLQSLINPKSVMMAVVKANAYGHGALKVAEAAIEAGVSWLGVALPEEGAELRESGITVPILVLGQIDKSQSSLPIQYDLVQTVSSIAVARQLNEESRRLNKAVKIHLKLDTGMGRLGFQTIEEVLKASMDLKSMSSIHMEGAFTHFAAADEADHTYTKLQIRKFKNMIHIMQKSGIQLNWIHASNSAGIFNFPEANFSMVRPGISVYGYYPSAYIKSHAKVKLLPVLQWKTTIVHIKTMHVGETVSYGRSYVADKTIIVGTLPLGYADGYPRNLSNKASVLVSGKKAPIIGKICMDQMMIDITDIPEASVGSEVVLIGEQGGKQILADELAELSGTISYEILTSISERVPRLYV
ncbi:MAG: alanine racemase [Caldicoprobacterales bacterium]